MKGYLSRIAHQSGVRIASQTGARAGEVRATVKNAESLPIERDEVVMLPPTASSEVARTASLRTPEEGSVIANKLPGPGLKTSREPSSQTERPLAAEGIQQEPKRQATRDDRNPPQKILARSEETFSSITQTPTIEADVVKQTIAVENQPTFSKTDSDPAPAPGPEEKDFFSKTVELIGGRSVERSEAQSIVIRELQEWVASGLDAALPETIGLEATRHRDDEDQVKTLEPEPGVVRITGQRKRERRPEQPEQQAASHIEESTFDLSIGTVTVVVEGDATAPQNHLSPPAKSPRDRGHTGERKTVSRMRRNYL